jgi:hypothetical protein
MCNERERLIGYVYDDGDAAERRAIDRHLETCEECREEIAGLRRTRQDLLAWDVPDHDSVWRPFAPAQTPPWWRQVPAWAMAAAAGVMFAVGLAGGATAHALLGDRAAAMSAERHEPADGRDRVVPAGYVSADQLTATERRILALMRDDLARVNRNVQIVSGRTGGLDETFDRALADRAALRAEIDRLQQQYMNAVDATNLTINELNDRARRLEVKTESTSAALSGLLSGGGGGR